MEAALSTARPVREARPASPEIESPGGIPNHDNKGRGRVLQSLQLLALNLPLFRESDAHYGEDRARPVPNRHRHRGLRIHGLRTSLPGAGADPFQIARL